MKKKYQFTAMPTNLFFACDVNCRTMLATLFQLNSMYADNNGWFYRSIADLEVQTKLSKNLVRATLQTLNNNGVIQIELGGRMKPNKYQINWDKVEEYEKLSIEDAIKNKVFAINTIKYDSGWVKTTAEKTAKIDPYNTEKTAKIDPYNTEKTAKIDPHNTEKTAKIDPHNSEKTAKIDPHNSEKTAKIDPNIDNIYNINKNNNIDNNNNNIIENNTNSINILKEEKNIIKKEEKNEIEEAFPVDFDYSSFALQELANSKCTTLEGLEQTYQNFYQKLKMLLQGDRRLTTEDRLKHLLLFKNAYNSIKIVA